MFQGFPEDNKNSDDFLDEFRQKLADQTAAGLEEKRREIRHSKNVFIGAVSGVALAGVVGWLVLSPQYAANNPGEIPVIRRPQTAVKIQPAEPGGMEIQNQDKSVYDILEKKNDNTKVENLLPPPETPQLPVITPPEAQTAELPSTAESDALAEKAQAIIEEADSKNIAKLPEPKMVDIPAEAPVKALAQEAPQEKVPAPQKAAQENKDNIALPDKETIKVVIKEETSVAAKGNWQLQLMSSPNKAAIDKSWSALTKKYSSLQGLPHEVETADLGAKGTFYRLKAGNFSTQAEANALCSELKSLGGTCIVKKK